MEIKDKIISSSLVEEIPNLNCMICGSKDHLLDKCNFGHFDRSNIFLYFKHNFSNP